MDFKVTEVEEVRVKFNFRFG